MASASSAQCRVVYSGAGVSRGTSTASWGPFTDQQASKILVASGRCVQVIHPDGSTVHATLQWHSSNVRAVTWNQMQPLSGDDEGKVALWPDACCGEPVATWDAPAAVTSLKAQALTVAACTSSGHIITWLVSADNAQESLNAVWQNEIPLCVGLNAKGSVLFVGSSTGRVAVIDLPSKTEILSLPGPSSWLYGLDCTSNLDDGSVLVATGFADSSVRAWQVAPDDGASAAKDETGYRQTVRGGSLRAMQLTVIRGHNDIVYGVSWAKGGAVLMSSSLDGSVCMWKNPEFSEDKDLWGVWECFQTLGTVGGSLPGFYGCSSSPDGQSVVAQSHTGSLHGWSYGSEGTWRRLVLPSGHTAAVTDVSWHPSGAYLLTCSEDMTSRVLAPCRVQSDTMNSADSGENVNLWLQAPVLEVARSQVHGFGIRCVAHRKKRHAATYVCGSDDEKVQEEDRVLRVLCAPQPFADELLRHSGVHIDAEGVAASTPALGLSNKGDAVADASDDAEEGSVSWPPYEEQLRNRTLWPEISKLYGCANPPTCVCIDSQGQWCVAGTHGRDEADGCIRVWTCKSWEFASSVPAHRLGVTTLAFDETGRYLCSGSRDRSLIVWEVLSSPSNPLQKLCSMEGAHGRMVRCVTWLSEQSHRTHHGLLSGGRDKYLRYWTRGDDASPGYTLMAELQVPSGVSAVAALPGSMRVAVGLDSGQICIVSVSRTLEILLWASQGHSDSVNTLTWRPREENPETDEKSSGLLLASCSNDGCVRVMQFSGLS